MPTIIDFTLLLSYLDAAIQPSYKFGSTPDNYDDSYDGTLKIASGHLS